MHANEIIGKTTRKGKPKEYKQWKTRCRKQLIDLEALGVVWVQCAGNEGFLTTHPENTIYRTGEEAPAAIGTPDNNMITVGAVNKRGQLCEWSSPEGAPVDLRYGTETGVSNFPVSFLLFSPLRGWLQISRLAKDACSGAPYPQIFPTTPLSNIYKEELLTPNVTVDYHIRKRAKRLHMGLEWEARGRSQKVSKYENHLLPDF